MKMWSGRFQQPLDPAFERWQRSFDFDRRLLKYELAASAAHARALKNIGVFTADELIGVLEGLQKIGSSNSPTPDSSNLPKDDNAEDVHHFVEKQLVSLIGDAGYKLHSGRSRNEQIATDLRLYIRAAIDQLRTELAEVCEAFVDRADQVGDSAMPAYTHLQRRAGSGGPLAPRLCRNVLTRCRSPGRLPQAFESVSAGVGRSRRCYVAAGSSFHGKPA
jgi:argininosuccinate lyase